MFVVLVAVFLSGYNKAIKLVPLRSTGPPSAAAYRNVRHFICLFTPLISGSQVSVFLRCLFSFSYVASFVFLTAKPTL